MAEPYVFEHDGVTIQYQRGTVKTGIEASRIRRKLVAAYGYETTMPVDEYDNIDEYASAMSRCIAEAPWRGHSNMTEEQLKQAFEVFLEEDEMLYHKFREASIATLPPKKTLMSVSQTSAP